MDGLMGGNSQVSTCRVRPCMTGQHSSGSRITQAAVCAVHGDTCTASSRAAARIVAAQSEPRHVLRRHLNGTPAWLRRRMA
jgi:hypothetical protein